MSVAKSRLPIGNRILKPGGIGGGNTNGNPNVRMARVKSYLQSGLGDKIQHLFFDSQGKAALALTKNTTDADLICLNNADVVESLQELDLGGTQISDAGLEHVTPLKNLESLVLYGTRVSDAGLVHLKGLRKLEELDLRHTKVRDELIQSGRKGLKNLFTLGKANPGMKLLIVEISATNFE